MLVVRPRASFGWPPTGYDDLMASRAEHAARSAAAHAKDGALVDRLGRYGLGAKGVSYMLVGALALALAVAGRGRPTSREGAVAALADEPGGAILLGAIAAGFAAYAVWRLVQAVFDREREGSDAPGVAKRVGYAGQAAVYAGMTYLTLHVLLVDDRVPSQTSQARRATAEVLDWPAGRWLVGLAGAALVGAGLYNGYRAVTGGFDEKWRTGEMSPAERRWSARIAVTGLLARLVVFGLVGAFLVKAAAEYDPAEAIGLDGALRKAAEASYGSWLLGLVAVGLACYGLTCLVEARYRRI